MRYSATEEIPTIVEADINRYSYKRRGIIIGQGQEAYFYFSIKRLESLLDTLILL